MIRYVAVAFAAGVVFVILLLPAHLEAEFFFPF